MTQKEIDKFLANTKVYVNGKSKEIQEKLFSFGFDWFGSKDNKVQYTQKPFLFLSGYYEISYADDMVYFTNHRYREITAEQILSLELTESYRPFKNREECWNEMLKHQPVGWIQSIESNDYYSMCNVLEETDFTHYAERYKFADGTLFGIKEE